jgi:hypothetical protein
MNGVEANLPSTCSVRILGKRADLELARNYRRERTLDLQTRGLLAGGVGTRGKLDRRGRDDGVRGWLTTPQSENGGGGGLGLSM